MNIKTTEEWSKMFYNKYPNSKIQIIGPYEGSYKNIECKCNVCQNIINPVARNLWKNGKCYMCSKHANSNKVKTTEEFVNDYYIKFPESTVQIIGKYNGYYEPIECKCSVCGKIWNPEARYLLRGNGCSSCSARERVPMGKFRKKKTQQEFEDNFYTKNPNSKITFGNYNGVKNHIHCKCSVCNYEWDTYVRSIISSGECPNCSGYMYNRMGRKKTQQEFEDSYYKKFPNSKILITGKYNGSREKIECKCTICQHIFYPKAENLIKGNGCPNCTRSKGNQLLEEIMITNNIQHKSEYYIPEIGKFFDNSVLYNSEIKCLFEYDGEQHFRNRTHWNEVKNAFEKRIIYDNEKNDYCRQNKIPLLRIPYTLAPIRDRAKIENIVLNFIKTKHVPQEILKYYSKYGFSNYVECVKDIEI